MTDNVLTTITTNDSLLANLVGEGKKFKDAEALAAGKLESDQFIERLKSENAEMRKDMQTLQSVVKEIKEARVTTPEQAAPQGVLAAEDLTRLVRGEIEQTETKRIHEANLVEADRVLVAKFGSKELAQAAITEKARELGMPVSWLVDSAAKNPKALYQLLGLAAQQTQSTVQTGTQSTVNTDAQTFVPQGQGAAYGTKAYFDALRKSNPSQYWSPKVQAEIHSKALAGEYYKK